MAHPTATTAVGLELGSDDGVDGTIGFDGEHSRVRAGQRDRFATSAAVPPGAADDCMAPAER
jgi:hypothetical protein